MPELTIESGPAGNTLVFLLQTPNSTGLTFLPVSLRGIYVVPPDDNAVPTIQSSTLISCLESAGGCKDSYSSHITIEAGIPMAHSASVKGLTGEVNGISLDTDHSSSPRSSEDSVRILKSSSDFQDKDEVSTEGKRIVRFDPHEKLEGRSWSAVQGNGVADLLKELEAGSSGTLDRERSLVSETSSRSSTEEGTSLSSLPCFVSTLDEDVTRAKEKEESSSDRYDEHHISSPAGNEESGSLEEHTTFEPDLRRRHTQVGEGNSCSHVVSNSDNVDKDLHESSEADLEKISGNSEQMKERGITETNDGDNKSVTDAGEEARAEAAVKVGRANDGLSSDDSRYSP